MQYHSAAVFNQNEQVERLFCSSHFEKNVSDGMLEGSIFFIFFERENGEPVRFPVLH